jgi:beta-lactamase regulating signal transducer with metallopeptidase domain
MSAATSPFAFAATTVFPVMIDTAIKGALLLSVALAASLLLRRSSAANRHAIWAIAAIGHLTLPLITWFAPPLNWRVLPAPPWLSASAQLSSATPFRSLTPGPMFIGALTVVWAVGYLIAVGRIALGMLMASYIKQHSIPLTSGSPAAMELSGLPRPARWRRTVRVRCSPFVLAPSCCGFFSSTILLPIDAMTWSSERLRFVLAHELEHARRFDTVTQLLADLALAGCWFDPLLVLACRRMRLERERACDDAVVTGGADVHSYAEELIRIARWLRDQGFFRRVTTLAVAESGDDVELRVKALMAEPVDRRPPSLALCLSAVLLLTALELPVGAIRPFRAPVRTPTLHPRLP